jgi:hypothetical protein
VRTAVVAAPKPASFRKSRRENCSLILIPFTRFNNGTCRNREFDQFFMVVARRLNVAVQTPAHVHDLRVFRDGDLLMSPWQSSQFFPAAMWARWLNWTKSGTMATGTHSMGVPLSTASFNGASRALVCVFAICS